MTAAIKKIWKNNIYQTIILISIIIAAIFTFWYGSQLVLNTEIPPMLAVESGSMCIPQGVNCDSWSHPFERTLHTGDIVIIQHINPEDLKTNYPDSDIIVFHQPDNYNRLIVHRITAKTEGTNGTLYFYTKGDGNPPIKYPATSEAHDSWGAVSENLIVGKVIMRIPWLGHISLSMRHLTENNIILPIIIALIITLIIIELILPLLRQKKNPN